MEVHAKSNLLLLLPFFLNLPEAYRASINNDMSLLAWISTLHLPRENVWMNLIYLFV
jgi:hypothetical protein